MDFFIADQRVQIYYSPSMREYYIPLKFQHAVQGIFYCPWCGVKLPESVRDQYFDILETEYGIESDLEMEEQEGFPEEFKTDEWWKNRGL